MIKEQYRNIFEYEGFYQVSNYGKIRRLHKNKRYKQFKILKLSKINHGHLQIKLCKNGICKPYLVHRLVLETFVGPCPPGMECRHLDGNPGNNKLENLKWGSKSENQQDSIQHKTRFQPNTRGSKNGMAILNDEQIKEIRKSKLKSKELAIEYGISISQIFRIKNKKQWKHII